MKLARRIFIVVVLLIAAILALTERYDQATLFCLIGFMNMWIDDRLEEGAK